MNPGSTNSSSVVMVKHAEEQSMLFSTNGKSTFTHNFFCCFPIIATMTQLFGLSRSRLKKESMLLKKTQL